MSIATLPVLPNRKLDELDRKLLGSLLRNARVSQEELSRELNLSRPAVRERMRRLEAMGVIDGYTIALNWEALGYPILAFVNIRTHMGTCEEGAQAVIGVSNENALVEECYPITGDWCLYAKIRAKTSRDLALLLDALKAQPRFAATSTTLALATTSTREAVAGRGGKKVS